MLVPILVAVGVSAVLGLITALLWWRSNVKVNQLQRALNKLENKLSAAGAEWLAGVLEDAIVGDLTTLGYKLATFVESDDITNFFIENIGMGVSEYTLRETAKYYPEKFNQLKQIVENLSNSSV